MSASRSTYMTSGGADEREVSMIPEWAGWSVITLVLALCYATLDRMEEARAHAAEFRKIDPKFSVKKWRRSRKLSVFKDQKWLDSVAEMMRKAGLPD